MTFYEIYARTIMRLYGDTTPPTSSVALLQGSPGLIADAYKRVQQSYNYWFMRAYTTWATVAETQTYGLPALYKSMISLQFKTSGENYFQDPMSPLKLVDPFNTQWNKNFDSVEYPQFYEINGNTIAIYPAPSEIRTLHMIYWSFFAQPVAADWVEASSSNNDLTDNAGDIISYLASSDYSLIMKEYDQAQVYAQKAEELTILLKEQDYANRQSLIQDVRYSEV